MSILRNGFVIVSKLRVKGPNTPRRKSLLGVYTALKSGMCCEGSKFNEGRHVGSREAMFHKNGYIVREPEKRAWR